MLIFLRPVLLSFLTAPVSAEVNVEHYGKASRDASLDGGVSDEHLLFQADVFSVLSCATACLERNCCAAFSTSPKDPPSNVMTCRGHDSKSVSVTPTFSVPGSKTYLVKEKPIESQWLKRPCTTESDCPAAVTNVTCFAHVGRCLCQPGYYYSHCRDACVPDCASQDLQTSFLKYPRLNIHGHNLETISNCTTFEMGRRRCVGHSRCRTLEIRHSEKCQLQEVTVLSPGILLKDAGGNVHYQRTCH